jgi:hypothetical protein
VDQTFNVSANVGFCFRKIYYGSGFGGSILFSGFRISFGKEYDLDKYDIIWPSAVPLIIASFGSVLGGWLPWKFIHGDRPVFRSRKTSMLIYVIAFLGQFSLS